MKIHIKVIANAKKEEIIPGTPLIVKTKKPPKNGKANRAVIKLLVKHYQKPVKIISGYTTQHKQIEIQDTPTTNSAHTQPPPKKKYNPP